MGSTKIINVLKDDKFGELLDIVKETNASEVIFVLPKKAGAFKAEVHFEKLKEELKKDNKSVAFLCSNPEINELARKYDFNVLSTKSEEPKAKSAEFELAEPLAVPVVAKDDKPDEDEEENAQDEFGEHHPAFGKEPEEPEEVVEETPKEEEEEKYKEMEPEEETVEDEPPYGTEVDESGNPVYDEEEEKISEQIAIKKPVDDFQVVTASVVTRRGMGDVTKPGAGKNVKVVQKDKGSVKVETRREKIAGFDWKSEPSQNIWADISKPRSLKPSFLSKLKLLGRYKPKGSFEFKPKNFLRGRGMRGEGPVRSRVYVAVLSIASIIILGFIIFLTTGSAKIEIKPRSQKLNTQMKVTMSPSFSSVDNSFNRIPGQLFTIKKSASDELNATAEKDAVQKSRGTITIYNEYSTSPQPLVATTRFEYIRDEKGSGLVFRTLQTITVPGMKVENDVVTPGRVNVEVIADKAGQAYNVPVGSFGIMAWREKGDTARYEKMYGRSSDPMRGGILGKAKVVSEFDYNNAKDRLAMKIKNDISEALKAQSAGLELLASIEPKIDSVESTAEIDAAADTFTMTVSGSITTIGFKKEDLLSLVSWYVGRTDLMVVPEKLELSYKDAVIDPVGNTLRVTVVLGGNAYAKIDQEDIAANLAGKNETQIKDYLSSVKNIETAKVILSPFWVKKIPKNKEKINISLIY